MTVTAPRVSTVARVLQRILASAMREAMMVRVEVTAIGRPSAVHLERHFLPFSGWT
jgi:hypothetical protein